MTTRPISASPALLAVVLAVLVLASGCGGSSATGAAGRPATQTSTTDARQTAGTQGSTTSSPSAGGALPEVPSSGHRVGLRPSPVSRLRRRIGTSVDGRPLLAYRVGDKNASPTAVVLGNMHGDEPAGVRLVDSIRAGRPVRGIDLWVVPTINPDGLAAHTRQNAHGVDLNRNWGYKWVRRGGRYNSGPRPFSEPETRALRSFLNRVNPRFIVSFHQPLRGVDSSTVKSRRLMNRLARNLNLPRKPFRCSGVCHGTLTGWYNAHHAGTCITVEFGPHPSRAYLTGRAARGTVVSLLGRY